MRKNIFLFLILCLTIYPIQTAISDESTATIYTSYKDIPGVTAEEISAVEALRLKYDYFVYGMNYSAEAFEKNDGNIGGFTSLFCKQLSTLFGFEFRTEICDWDELVSRMDTHEISFTSELTATPERMLKYHMTRPIQERFVKTFTLRTADKLSQTAQVRPLNYAFFEGTVTYNYIAENESKSFETFYVDSYEQAAQMLRDGTIDAFFEENTAEAAFDIYDDIKSENYFPLIYSSVSFTTANPELAPIVSIVDKYIDNPDVISMLRDINQIGYQDYLRYKINARLTDEEKDYISNHLNQGKAIPIIAEYDNYPVSFYNEQEKELQGIAMDVLEQISDITGLSFEPINAKEGLWVDLMEKLKNGEAAMLSELIHSSQREGQFLWAQEPYCVDNYALLSRLDQPDADINHILNAKVGLIQGSAYEEAFKKWFPSNKNTVTYESNEEAFSALENGEISFVMATQNLLLSITNYSEKPGFKANYVFEDTYESLFGFNKSQTVLCSIISKTQRIIDTNIISERWTRKTFDYRSKLAEATMPYTIGLSAILLLTLLCVVIMLIRKRRMNKSLGELVDKRTRELALQTEAAQVASRSKGEFLSRMSHEIRTPLNAIIGMTLIAKRDVKLPERALRSINEISVASSHLLEILNDVLDMSKIEAGKMEMNIQPFDLGKAMVEVGSIISQRCNDRDVIFDTNVVDIGSIGVSGDRMRLKQVLINLLGNAVKFTGNKGKISFCVNKRKETSDFVFFEFSVADTGIGMTKEQVSHLFQPFEQADSTIAGRFGGTGLGLAISQNLVKQMGGEITVASKEYVGSTFSFSLQFDKCELEHAGESIKDAIVPDLTDKRILLAEDVEINRIIVKELLAETNVIIDEAENGLKAVDMFDASAPFFYNMIFMDVQMPELNGYDATMRIRALDRPDAKIVPIFAMTANAYKEDIDHAFSSGMTGHLAKPIDIDQVMRILHDRLLG